jgi:hypothetical protein
MSERRPPLHLPFPAGRPIDLPRRRRRRRSSRWRQAGAGLGLGAAGAGLLLLLLQLPERLDTLLLVSDAIANLIGGLGRFSLGLVQLAGLLGVAALALFALLLLVAGGIRLIRAIAPRGGKSG